MQPSTCAAAKGTIKKDPAIIEAAVCEYLGITVDHMKDKNRRSLQVRARQIAIYLMYHRFTMSLSAIGRRFGRDHTTIMYNLRMMDNYLSTEESMRQDVRNVENMI
jgi:chromosomal replication initiator protein